MTAKDETCAMPPEQRLLLLLAQPMRSDHQTQHARRLLAQSPNWALLRRLASRNRMLCLLFHGLADLDALAGIPAWLQHVFELRYAETVTRTDTALAETATLTADLADAGIPAVLLRGPALGIRAYGKPYLREFSDLDILVRPDQARAALQRLYQAGYSRPPGSFPDTYFLRHHLHVALEPPPPRTGMLELHWALDHPFTSHTLDVAAILERVVHVSHRGASVPVLTPEDEFPLLCLHAVKHCPFLPDFLGQQDFLSLLLGSHTLLWLFDIHVWSRRASSAKVDWPACQGRTTAWGLAWEVNLCRQAAARLEADALAVQRAPCANSGGASVEKRRLYASFAELRMRTLRQPGRGNRVARMLFGLHGHGLFRPIRVLDWWSYVFAPGSALRRIYGATAWPPLLRMRHVCRAFGLLAAHAFDYLWCRLALVFGRLLPSRRSDRPHIDRLDQ